MNRRTIVIGWGAGALGLVQAPAASAANAWLGYADNLLATGKLTGAGILAHDGAIWAQRTLGLLPEEAKVLAGAFKDVTPVRAKGLFVNKVRYMVLGASDMAIAAKKSGGGVYAIKTKLTIVVGAYGAGVQPGDALMQVEKMAAYLLNSNY